MILICSGYLGILFSGRFKKRVRQLEELQNAMLQLEFDIDFLNVTLCEAFEGIAKNTDGILKEVFFYVADRLQKSPGCDMQRLWQRAMIKYSDDLALTEEDIQIIRDFSKTLGSGNREKEKNNIKVTQMRLKIAVDEAVSEAKKNIKMYRGLGLLSGVFMVIVLV